MCVQDQKSFSNITHLRVRFRGGKNEEEAKHSRRQGGSKCACVASASIFFKTKSHFQILYVLRYVGGGGGGGGGENKIKRRRNKTPTQARRK